ncbi:nuclear transport factor 2 family protein [uncultured Draconibacterium sp.]|uniref:nuclear transport factor 2 family protein n=1 Tax=uncultured Draconibacterium sp. TaxID=1573823 RepID=UPI0029C6BA1A|nr:nuclear transport factor 2 family protein [uncultured Draconibacterium sp.]
MKNLFLFLGLLVILTACQTVDPEQEKAAVETTLNDFYAAMEDFNYDAMRNLCTADFSVYETGFDHSDLDGLIASVKSMEGANLNVTLDIDKTEVVGDMALVLLQFKAAIENSGTTMNIDANENYVLKKENGKWLMYYCLSTHLPDKSDKHLASLHLLKIPDAESVDVLQDAMKKFNQVIAEMGFWDCGYTVMQVVSDSNDEYNYFIKGNWKNQETYDAIHDSEGWKSVSDNFPEEASKLLEDQIYLKIVDL